MDALLFQALVNGILLGGIYVLVSIGLSFAFGVMHLINVAQGDLVMLGAFLAYWIFFFLGIDPIATFPVVLVVFFFIGYYLQRFIVKHVMGAPPLMNLVLFFGLSIIIANVSLLVFGPYSRIVTSPLSGVSFNFGGIMLPIPRFLAFILAFSTIIILFLFLQRTRIGMAIRATAQDKNSARLMGINVEKIHAITLGIGFSTAGMAGALISSIVSIQPMMGGIYTLFAFFITVLGGMGYLPGTLVGGLILGIVQSLFITYYGTQAIFFVLFIILYVILIFSPKGIFGKGM